MVDEKRAAEQGRRADWVQRFGYAAPPMTAVAKGARIVVVAGRMHSSNKWKSFDEFLGDFIKHTLGPDWGTEQIKRPWASRHPILRWYHHFCLEQRQHVVDSGLVHGWNASGHARAYIWLAYDLYTLANARALPQSKIDRLKIRRQFQGTRYELHVAAALVRADIDIAWIDESDGSRRHSDLVATHRPTGDVYSVEIKSRHRPGVMGQPGQRAPDGELSADVERLLKDAMKKSAEHKRLIVIDVNLPMEQGDVDGQRAMTDLMEQLYRMEGSARGQPALVIFTNQPDHYKGESFAGFGAMVSVTAYRVPEFHETRRAGGSEKAIWDRIKASWPGLAMAYHSLRTWRQWPNDFGDGVPLDWAGDDGPSRA